MSRPIEKVTAFITRRSPNGHDLLLFEHPNAGIQIPAGTVEDGETPEQAIIREVNEETGLAPSSISIRQYLGCAEHRLSEEHRIIAKSTTVYARPDVTSFDWSHLRTGIPVVLSGRRADGFSQVTYEEFDRVPDPQYVTMCIIGWVPDDVLIDVRKRYFFHIEFHGHSQERWTVYSDNHHFGLFWAPLADLPEIIHPQDEWIEFLHRGDAFDD
ncbi:MAG: NUDIX domain-containing protein [Chloroflexi bacterium]|nr:NUDIX domain-containing protein [Chloroflexota bacterium]